MGFLLLTVAIQLPPRKISAATRSVSGAIHEVLGTVLFSGHGQDGAKKVILIYISLSKKLLHCKMSLPILIDNSLAEERNISPDVILISWQRDQETQSDIPILSAVEIFLQDMNCNRKKIYSALATPG